MTQQPSRELSVDAYAPAEIAHRVHQVGITKAQLGFAPTFALAMVAGAFIGLGAQFFTVLTSASGLAFGLSQLSGGLVFCLGLILVVVAGAELFTGNVLLIVAWLNRQIPLRLLLRNWVIVYIGNLVGALSLVALITLSEQWRLNDGGVGTRALVIANNKVNLSFSAALVRGILCNALVCLAIWLCYSARSTTDKILAILFPITAFVACGFEHSVANMYFIPQGLVLKEIPAVVQTAAMVSDQPMNLANLTVAGFLWNNLLPVTIGNILGGAVLVGAIYYFVYLAHGGLRQKQQSSDS